MWFNKKKKSWNIKKKTFYVLKNTSLCFYDVLICKGSVWTEISVYCSNSNS